MLLCLAARDMRGAGNVLADPGFEAEVNRWQVFVPKDSSEATVKLSFAPKAAHDGKYGAVLSSDVPARVGLYPQPQVIAVHAGEELRVRVWVKPGPKFAVQPGTPGVVIRATLFDRQGNDHPDGHIFIGLKGTAKADPSPLAAATIAEGWNKIEGTFEVPKGAERMEFFIFMWQASGTLYVDDAAVERL